MDNDLKFELEENIEEKKKQKSVNKDYVIRVIILGMIAEFCIMCFFHFLPNINALLFSLLQGRNSQLDGTIIIRVAFWELWGGVACAVYVMVHCIYIRLIKFSVAEGTPNYPCFGINIDCSYKNHVSNPLKNTHPRGIYKRVHI